MPRKAKSLKGARSQAAAGETEPQQTLAEEQQAGADKAGPKERDTEGKFTKGNSGGPGNPHARACAKMLEVFRNAISEQEMVELCRMLYLKAVGGDISAAKIILSYKIGKPLPAPHPDSIDRDEWDHYQEDAIREEEMKLALSSLPTRAGNDIVRVSLPIVTAGRMNDLAAQLLDGLPPKKDEGGRMKGEPKTETTEPIAKGKSGRENAEQGEGTDAREAPIANGKKGRAHAKRKESSEEHAEMANTRKAPIANGKKGKAAEARSERKRARPHWLQPLAKELQGSERR